MKSKEKKMEDLLTGRMKYETILSIIYFFQF